MSWTITPQTKVPVDPYRSQVSLLLHGDGANGSTTITDSSPTPKTVTASNGAAISTSEKRYGAGSIYFNGSTQSLSFSGVSLGSDSFTIEFWLKTNSSVQYAQIIGNELVISSGPTIVDGFTLLVNHNSSTDGQIRLYVNTGSITSTSVVATSNGDFSDDQWHHIAVTRNGNAFTIWTDGSANGTGTWTQDIDGDPTWYIGRNNALSPRNLVGYIDDLRITKGVARYTSNFTPPTAPFPDI